MQGLYFGWPARALSPRNGAPLFWARLLKRAGVLFREKDSPDEDVFRATRLLRRPMHPARMRMRICTIPVKVCEVPAAQVAKFGVDSFQKFLIEICKAGVGVFPPIGKYELWSQCVDLQHCVIL